MQPTVKKSESRFVLAVSGVPCSGKTALCRKLGPALGAKVISLNDLVAKEGIFEGVDRDRDTKVVDVKRLKARVLQDIGGDTVLDGLISHRLGATHVLVLRCDPVVLAGRMRKRGYSRRKIRENVEAEYEGTILYESLKACGNVYEVDATRGVDVGRVGRWLKRGGRRVSEKDWSRRFVAYLRSDA